VTDDQERLVAEALRAHAARTPLPEPEQVDATADPVSSGGHGPPAGGAPPRPDRPPDPLTVQTPGYPVIHPAALPTIPPSAPLTASPDRTGRLEPAGGVSVGWVVLLALLLGLASGAVVGLLTLL
jgi:hypothetical protein